MIFSTSNTQRSLHLLFTLILCYANQVSSQHNLIKNAGFEAHKEITCLSCDIIYGRFPAFVYEWDNLGVGRSLLIDKRYKLNDDEKKAFRKEIPLPQEGFSMINLDYVPNCGGWGCIDYLCAKTTETLKVGNLYELSYWLYLESWEEQDTNWAKHIGMAILPKKVGYSYDFRVPALNIDTVMYDQWYQVKWKVRPLCNSDFIMIGTFRTDDWPSTRSFDQSYYYIDQVSVRELPDPDGGLRPDSSVHYCSQYDPQKNPKLRPDLDRLQLYFETASAELTAAGRTALDTLSVFANRYPNLIFEVSGHTDSIGTENELLSHNRVQEVVNYLQTRHGIPSFRLIQCGFGSTRPISTNQTAEGRALNRRVEIRVANMTLPQAYYRYALTTDQVSEKFKYLHKWQKLVSAIEHHSLMLDPRFDNIKKDKRWHSLQQQAHEAYSTHKYPRQAFVIDSLFIDDELTTGSLTRALNFLSGYSPAIDSFYFDGLPEYSEAAIEQKAIERYERGYKALLKQLGWPTKSVWGETTQNSAFFLLFHSNDTAAMEAWLPTVKAACEAGEALWGGYARLYDRCQVLQKKPQKYGFEVQYIGEKIYVQPCEGDREEVNRLRAKLNLPLVPPAHILY
jgi:outer membrane protein OmpA-like peptidoglycan-associated protein